MFNSRVVHEQHYLSALLFNQARVSIVGCTQHVHPTITNELPRHWFGRWYSIGDFQWLPRIFL